MKSKRFPGILLLMLLWAGPLFASQRGFAPQVKELAPFRYMCYEYVGYYIDFPKVEKAFLTHFRSAKVTPMGKELALYWNSPYRVAPEDLRYDIGIPVAPNQKPIGKLVVKDFLYSRVASVIHVGPYNTTYLTTNALYKWIAANGFRIVGGPCVEVYLDDNPERVPDYQKQTEILIPIQ